MSFSARGLSGHRRLRHGLNPPPALPRESNRPPEVTPSILNALAGLQDAIERVELRLTSLGKPPAAPETPAEEATRLQGELAQLFEQILRIKRSNLASTTMQHPASPVEKHASLELARLRRDQARLVFRIEELRHGEPSDERFLV